MTSPTVDFQNAIERVIAICTEAVPGAAGKPYWFHSEEAPPFFIGQVRNVIAEHDESDEIDSYSFNVVARHFIANRTAGVQGEVEGRLYAQMPMVLAALLSRDLLQSDEYPDPPGWLEQVTRVTCSGLGVFDASAIGLTGDQIGTEYVVSIAARLDNDQDYE